MKISARNQLKGTIVDVVATTFQRKELWIVA
jgi:molybdopterin-binding protein